MAGEFINKHWGPQSHIVDVRDGLVTFKWKDYRDNKMKQMTLEVFEFIRLVALDKQLEVHQETFQLWHELFFSISKPREALSANSN